MKNNILWFSLVEIIVWISISMMIMIWVWAFVTDAMKNINYQRNIIFQDKEIFKLNNELKDILSYKNIFFDNTNSWIFIKIQNDTLWNNLKYLWIKTFTWYCKNEENKNKEFKKIYLKDLIYTWITNNTSHITLDKIENKILSWSEIIFDENNGILNPKSVYLTWNKLFISNSWVKKWILLDYEKESSISWTLSFVPNSDISFDSFEYKIFSWSQIYTTTVNTWSFSFDWISPLWTWSVISDTNSWFVYTFSWTQTISSWNTINITLNTLPLWDNYYFWEVNLYSWTNHKWKYINSIYDNNTKLKDLFKNIPLDKNTEFDIIFTSWNKVVYSDLINKKDYIFSNTWSYISSGSNYWYNSTNLETIKEKDFNIIIQDLKVDITNSIFTLKIDYYPMYDCYDDYKNHIKTILIKKFIWHN